MMLKMVFMESEHVIKYFVVNLLYKMYGNLNGKMKIINKMRNMVCTNDINNKYNGKMI